MAPRPRAQHAGYGLEVSRTSASSPAPYTSGWLASICSTSVVPDRGSPTMNTGRFVRCPAPESLAKNARSNVSIKPDTRRSCSSG